MFRNKLPQAADNIFISFDLVSQSICAVAPCNSAKGFMLRTLVMH